MATALSILVVEDDPIQSEVLCAFIVSNGHQALAAFNGSDALARFGETLPDIVLIDYDLPDINGEQLVAALRAKAERWVPILFLSATHSVEVQRDCLLAGGDDFITKPFDYPLLAAKIAAMCRIALLQKQVGEQNEQLSDHINRAKQENEAARYLYDRLIRSQHPPPEYAQHDVLPAEQFSGDLLAFNVGPNGHLYWLLADATGHGLSAAISLIPVTQVFYSMTSKGYLLSAIVGEMHKQLRQYIPAHRFVCTLAIELDPDRNSLLLWNGGMPDALLTDGAGGLHRRFFSQHLPLGLQGAGGFDNQVEQCQYPDGAVLFACSDGLPEACNANGEEFGNARIENVLLGQDGPAEMATLQQRLQSFLQQQPAHDDVAMLWLRLPTSRTMPTSHNAGAERQRLAACEWRLRLSGLQLQHLDPVPLATEWLNRVGLAANVLGTAHTILVELVNNAIDHGLLELSSALKEGEDGFSVYFAARQQRLSELCHGELKLELAIEPRFDRWQLRIQVTDSGKGYDVAALREGPLQSLTAKSGRGLKLVHQLSDEVEILPTGNACIAILRL